jgi:putative hemolysin
VLPANLGALHRVMMVDRMMALYTDAISQKADRSFFEAMLSILNVQTKVSPEDLDRIPRTGAAVVVANHPFGFIEGGMLGALLPSIRPDVKIMANSLLSVFPNVTDRFIYVNPFGGAEAKKENLRGMRESIDHLRTGGLLVVFPAGEVAHINLRKGEVTDPEWSPAIARLIRMTRASVVPMYFSGANSPLFHLLGLLHPRLRTAMLPHEIFNKQHREIELRIGSPIPERKLTDIKEDAAMIRYLRWRTYILKHRDSQAAPRSRILFHTSIVAAAEPALLRAEVDQLPADRKLSEVNGCATYYARSYEIPNILREIGRLREITFRQSGEGTGKSIDLDSFDAYYIQLFAFNAETNEIVGGYRLGAADEITPRFGTAGLYTNTLFSFKDEFLATIASGLELGRSFVRPEYQKSYAPLLLLWKGIGTYVARNPRYKILFGPVSISNDYQHMSRQFMVNYFRQRPGEENLMRLVRARSPFRGRALTERPRDVEDLSALVADIETDQKGIPVLLRQYLKLGGRLLAFNVDKKFANALDGLILVDLTHTDSRMLSRYLGDEGATDFLNYQSCIKPGR